MNAKIMKQLKNNTIYVILFLFVVSRLLFMSRIHSVIWDESVYISIGKYIYSLGKIGLWEVIRPPGLPLVLGFFWKMGFNAIVLGELIAVLFSSLSIYFVYIIGKEIFNDKTGLIAASFYAATPLFFLYSPYILTEIPSLFFCLAAIYSYIKTKNLLLAGFFSAVAFLFRFPTGLILVVFILLFFSKYLNDRNLVSFFKRSLKYCLVFFATVLPYLLFNYFFYREYTSKFWHALLRPFLLGAEHQYNPMYVNPSLYYNLTYYFYLIFSNCWFYIFVILGVIFYLIYKKYKDENINLLYIVFLVFTAYFVYIPNKQDRYALNFLAYFALVSAYGVYCSYAFLVKKGRGIKYCMNIILLLFLVATAGASINKDRIYYKWRLAEPTPIISEFYNYFNLHPVDGAIMTTDPVPAAYTDKKFIPYYFFLSRELAVYNEWEKDEKIGAIIYTPRSFYCAEGDAECIEKKQSLFDELNKEYNLVFEKEYYGEEYYIFTT